MPSKSPARSPARAQLAQFLNFNFTNNLIRAIGQAPWPSCGRSAVRGEAAENCSFRGLPVWTLTGHQIIGDDIGHNLKKPKGSGPVELVEQAPSCDRYKGNSCAANHGDGG